MVWDPREWPASLAIRDFAPTSERLASAHGRLRALPGFLQGARQTLGEMSAIHVETALQRLAGFDAVLTNSPCSAPWMLTPWMRLAGRSTTTADG